MIEILAWKKTEWDFVGKRRIAFVFSAALCAIGLFAMIQIARGVAPLGIDFAGGVSMNVAFKQRIPIDDIRKAFGQNGLGGMDIMEIKSETGQRLLIRLSSPEQEATATEVLQGLAGDKSGKAASSAGGGAESAASMVVEGVQEVGPAVGKELQRKAAWAVFWAIILIMVYIWWRFEYRFGVTAAIATIHDVLAVLGIMFLLNKDFTLLILTALLTLAGYSLTDTVVLYDRIRENMRLRRRANEPLSMLINASINEILSRSIITSTTTLFPLAALLVYGSQVTFDFALALALGILVGTYSSWFVASPLLVEWEDYRRRKSEQAALSKGS